MNSPIGTKTHHIETEEYQQQRENAEAVGVGMNYLLKSKTKNRVFKNKNGV